MMRFALLLSLTVATTVATAASGVADSGPSVISEAGVVRPGDRYVLQGDSWFVGPRCESRVQVSQRENQGVCVGSARVRDTARSRSTAAFHAAPGSGAGSCST